MRKSILFPEKASPSIEALFGLINSKPKLDNRNPLETKRVLKQTFLNDTWLSQQKFKADPITLRYINSLAPNVEQAWNQYYTEVKKYFTEIDRKMNGYLKLVDELQGKLDTRSFTQKDDSHYSKLFKSAVIEYPKFKYLHEKGQSIKPLNRDEAKRAALFYSKLIDVKLNNRDPFQDRMNEFLDNWYYSNNSKYRDILDELDPDPDHMGFDGFAVQVRWYLVAVEPGGKVDMESEDDARTEFLNNIEEYLNKSIK